MFYTALPDRAILKVSGKDSRDFLQGLVSNNMRYLKHEHPLYAAMLTPQGKFLFDFIMIQGVEETTLLLDVAAETLPALVKRLSMYKLRSEVVLELQTTPIYAVWGEALKVAILPEGITLIHDPRLDDLGERLYGDAKTVEEFLAMIGAEKATPEAYDSWRLQQGIPLGGIDMIPEKSLLLEYHFEALHGVDFLKGCYVGQEVTARSKHRATLRKMLHQVEVISGEAPALGTILTANGKQAGEMLSSRGKYGLAMLRLEETAEASAAGALLEAGESRLSFKLPDYEGN